MDYGNPSAPSTVINPVSPVPTSQGHPQPRYENRPNPHEAPNSLKSHSESSGPTSIDAKVGLWADITSSMVLVMTLISAIVFGIWAIKSYNGYRGVE